MPLIKIPKGTIGRHENDFYIYSYRLWHYIYTLRKATLKVNFMKSASTVWNLTHLNFGILL